MIGAEIYNNNGELYFSTKQPPNDSIILYQKIQNKYVQTDARGEDIIFDIIELDIPVQNVCMPFVQVQSGYSCTVQVVENSNGRWRLVVAHSFDDPSIPPELLILSSYIDVYIFSNLKKPVVDSGYGFVCYDENGVPVFNHTTKNLRFYTQDNLPPYEGGYTKPHPVAVLPSPVYGVYTDVWLISALLYVMCTGRGNVIEKVRYVDVGEGNAGTPDWEGPYPQKILYINTNEY